MNELRRAIAAQVNKAKLTGISVDNDDTIIASILDAVADSLPKKKLIPLHEVEGSIRTYWLHKGRNLAISTMQTILKRAKDDA